MATKEDGAHNRGSMRLSAIFVALFLFGSAKATVVRIEPLTQMVENADVIAYVVVGDKSTRTDASGRTIQLSSVEVIKGIKGARTGEVLTIYQVAGIVGQSRVEFGEEMVLFGMRFGELVVSYGVGLGKFRILRDGHQTPVLEDLHDVVTPFGEPKARRYSSVGTFMDSIEQALVAPWRVVHVGPRGRK